MKQLKSTSELKALAKSQLSGNYTTAVVSICIISFISVVISFFVNSFTSPYYTTTGLLLYYMISAILQIFINIFRVGNARLYLNIVCKRSPDITDIFYGFRNHTDKAIIFSTLYFLASIALLFPTFLFLFLFVYYESIIFALLLTISLILSMIGLSIFGLTYSQCFYLIVDLPNYSIMKIMKTSAHIMKGNRLKLLYLHVSFIGLFLLGFLTCFISNLWVSPYLNATTTNFYLDLMNMHSNNNGE